MATPGTDRRPSLQTRTLQAGPALGFYELITWSIDTVTANARLRVMTISDLTVCGVGFRCVRSGGTGPTAQFAKHSNATGAPFVGISSAFDLTAVTESTEYPPTLNSERIVDASVHEAMGWIVTPDGGTISQFSGWALVRRNSHLLGNDGMLINAED